MCGEASPSPKIDTRIIRSVTSNLYSTLDILCDYYKIQLSRYTNYSFSC